MLNIGPQELIIVLIIALVVVGPQRLPELGRTIGRAMREFRKIQDDVKDSIRFDMNTEPDRPVRPGTAANAPVEAEPEGAADEPSGEGVVAAIEGGAADPTDAAVIETATPTTEPGSDGDAGPLASG
jgi:Tat protein translocase TatB subunit